MPWVSKATDDFQRANETPLAGNWTTTTSESAFNLTSNVAIPSNDANDCGTRYSGRVWADNQYSSALITSPVAGSDVGAGLCVRVASGARTYYRCVISADVATDCTFRRFIAGASTQLVQFTTSFASGDRVTFRVSGPASAAFLEVLVNGVSAGTFLDNSSLQSGSPGMSYSSNQAGTSLNDWEGGEYDLDPIQSGMSIPFSGG
jgi:hypothetical protein